MQLGLSFSVLLTTLLFALTQVEAVPVNPRTVTLPLKRLSQQSCVHPTVVSPTLDLLHGRDRDINHAFPSFCSSTSIAATAAMRG